MTRGVTGQNLGDFAQGQDECVLCVCVCVTCIRADHKYSSLASSEANSRIALLHPTEGRCSPAACLETMSISSVQKLRASCLSTLSFPSSTTTSKVPGDGFSIGLECTTTMSDVAHAHLQWICSTSKKINLVLSY